MGKRVGGDMKSYGNKAVTTKHTLKFKHSERWKRSIISHTNRFTKDSAVHEIGFRSWPEDLVSERIMRDAIVYVPKRVACVRKLARTLVRS